MTRLAVAGLAGAAVLSACASQPAPAPQADIAAITAVIEAQEAAWNAGDVTGYMDGYIRGDALRFASGGSVTRGWQATHDRYAARYDTRAKMGMLDLSDLEISLLGPDAGVIHGRWALTRDGDTPSGLFTLIARRTDAGWRIVSDTTTSAD